MHSLLVQIAERTDPAIVAKDSTALIAAAMVAGIVSLIVSGLGLIGVLVTARVLFSNARAAAAAQLNSAETAAAAILSNARTSAYSATVTAERSKWINSLRGNIALFSGKLRTLSYESAVGNSSDKKVISEINDLISLILLQLNPFGPIEKNIAKLLTTMPAFATRPDGEKLRARDDLFIEHCRWLLKAEWEKVKHEASGQNAKADEEEYIRRYQEFCEAGGKIS